MILDKNDCTDCIPYIRDLKIEIETLKDLSQNTNKDLNKINEQIAIKEKLMLRCKNNLEKLSSYNVEAKIYLYMLNGMSATKAINKIVDENTINNRKPMDASTIWKYYYPNLKKMLDV